MAVIKTPRKKPTPVPPAVEGAPKRKTTAPRKAPAKKAVPATLEAAVEAAAPRKPRGRPRKADAVLEAAGPGTTALPPRVAVSPTPEEAMLPALAQALYSALRQGRPVELIFLDGDANAPRTFEPRQLLFDTLSQAWFVWGWDRRYNAERHHRLDLLAEVNQVEGVGRGAQGPYAEGTPANQIGGWLGGEPIAVKLTLQKQWVFAVKQAPPAFPQFKLEDQGEGLAQVSFTATDLRAIARWVMQFGDGAQILEPARLVDRVKQVGATWAGRERSAPALGASRPSHHAESAPEPRHSEPRPPSEPRPHREPRPEREETPKPKAGKVETLRFDRL